MMSRARHSYVPFFMDDWGAATAHMPRPVWSVLFQICLYNWDKAEPVPVARLKIMFADMGPGVGMDIVNSLVESGSLEVDETGIFSPRAIREANKAFDVWRRKSIGGKGGDKSQGGDNSGRDSGTLPTLLEESSEESSIEPDPDPEPEPNKKDQDGIFDFSAGRSSVVGAWNEMARRNGLKQAAKITSERLGKLDARLEEHGGPAALVAAIALVPSMPFLLGQGEKGWKATLDWFLRPDIVVKLIEGDYEPRKGGAPLEDLSGPGNPEEAATANERLEECGSTLRWRLEGGEWLLKPGR
jgi:hypothetical protein